jgi:hypothetical protein
MLLPNDLNIDVLVIILVKRGGGKRVADPEVYGVGALLKSYTSPRYIFLNMGK